MHWNGKSHRKGGFKGQIVKGVKEFPELRNTYTSRLGDETKKLCLMGNRPKGSM